MTALVSLHYRTCTPPALPLFPLALTLFPPSLPLFSPSLPLFPQADAEDELNFSAGDHVEVECVIKCIAFTLSTICITYCTVYYENPSTYSCLMITFTSSLSIFIVLCLLLFSTSTPGVGGRRRRVVEGSVSGTSRTLPSQLRHCTGIGLIPFKVQGPWTPGIIKHELAVSNS